MKNIIIIPNESKIKAIETAKILIEKINGRCNVFMSEKLSKYGFSANFINEENLYENADIAIALGGDGTILNIAEPCAKKGISILGINLGKIGFMTEVNIEHIDDALDKLFRDDFVVEKRMMIKATVKKSDGNEISFNALNDVVISKVSSPMITTEINSCNEKINSYEADGLIISTPTGSTGYSLSAGGPVADPTMELFIASPICAHMLHARPAIINSNKPITLSITGASGEKEAQITIDGVIKCNVGLKDIVLLEKSKYTQNIIKLGEQSFYDVLIDKLK